MMRRRRQHKRLETPASPPVAPDQRPFDWMPGEEALGPPKTPKPVNAAVVEPLAAPAPFASLSVHNGGELMLSLSTRTRPSRSTRPSIDSLRQSTPQRWLSKRQPLSG